MDEQKRIDTLHNLYDMVEKCQYIHKFDECKWSIVPDLNKDDCVMIEFSKNKDEISFVVTKRCIMYNDNRYVKIKNQNEYEKDLILSISWRLYDELSCNQGKLEKLIEQQQCKSLESIINDLKDKSKT